MVNLVLPFTILFATFIASLPTTDVTSHLSDIDTLDDRAPSDKPIIITPSIETDVSVKRTEISTPAIPQQPATTLATVISSSSATPAKGSGNSRQYAYYILKCIIGPTADKCYKIFGTQCNSSTGEMTGEAPALFTYDFKFIILLSLAQLPLAVAQSIGLNIPTAISASILSGTLDPTGTVIIYYASDTTVTSTLQIATLPSSPTGLAPPSDTSAMVSLLTDTLAKPSASSIITIGISTPTPLSSGMVSLASPTAVSSTTDSLMSPSTTVCVKCSPSSSSMMTTSTTATTSTSSAGAAATNFGVGLVGVLGAAAGVMAML
ncbi:hypothetical protein IFR04_008817 [Cadophora malorum]|uniref:Uncharacterized protein n=1 Tax=Cadophora malorum TaxID=108018 RepID=A0A8H7TAP3_9HELO|nr:hypothetical protein IFR04_008817 [Cadophora malorum]